MGIDMYLIYGNFKTTFGKYTEIKGYCRTCNKPIHHHGKYCNKKCNPRYNDSKIYKWKKEVLTRDNYTCQLCKSTDKPTAHHIGPYNRYKKLKYNIENGITLCDKCHKDFHNILGVKYNLTFFWDTYWILKEMSTYECK